MNTLTQSYHPTLKYVSVFSLFIFAYALIACELIAPSLLSQHMRGFVSSTPIYNSMCLLLTMIVIVILIPFLWNRYIYQQNIEELGVRLPKNKKKALFYIFLALVLLVPWMMYFSQFTEFNFYSLAGMTPVQIIIRESIFMPLYYFCEEFFFRGFLFISFYKRVGYHSFWITDILFTYAHLGKPGLEMLMCIPASIVFNFITMKTKSIYPAFIVHTSLGLLLNILMTFHINLGRFIAISGFG